MEENARDIDPNKQFVRAKRVGEIESIEYVLTWPIVQRNRLQAKKNK